MSDLSGLVVGAFEQNKHQQQRIEELEGVLQFYADSDNYGDYSCGREIVTDVEWDHGERARKVLYGRQIKGKCNVKIS